MAPGDLSEEEEIPTGTITLLPAMASGCQRLSVTPATLIPHPHPEGAGQEGAVAQLRLWHSPQICSVGAGYGLQRRQSLQQSWQWKLLPAVPPAPAAGRAPSLTETTLCGSAPPRTCPCCPRGVKTAKATGRHRSHTSPCCYRSEVHSSPGQPAGSKPTFPVQPQGNKTSLLTLFLSLPPPSLCQHVQGTLTTQAHQKTCPLSPVHG